MENIVVSFVGEKISKICWCKDDDMKLSHNEFVTGSDDCSMTSITMWEIPDSENNDSLEPYSIDSYRVNGSITDLHSISSNKYLYSTTKGEVGITHYDNDNKAFCDHQKWKALHQYLPTGESAACTCVAYNGDEIITGGEDGVINILYINGSKPVASIKQADSSNILGLEHLSNKEFVSINTTGQLKLWDMRLNVLETPGKIFTISGNSCPLLSVSKHPNQPHILVTGHGDGGIGVWDMRQERSPVALIDAHDSEVWQVMFHHIYSNNLFTCSQDGSCWIWNGTNMMSEASHMKYIDDNSLGMSQNDQDFSSSVWLYTDSNKHKLETFSLLPIKKGSINTFDVNMSTLICGTDNESIIIINDIPVRS